MNVYRVMTAVLALAFVAIGLALLVVTALHGGGVTGYALGVLFVAAGAGRIWVLRREGDVRSGANRLERCNA